MPIQRKQQKVLSVLMREKHLLESKLSILSRLHFNTPEENARKRDQIARYREKVDKINSEILKEMEK